MKSIQTAEKGWLRIDLSTAIGNVNTHISWLNEVNMPEKPHSEEDWWTPDQVDLANDRSKVWERKPFLAQLGYWIQTQNGRLLGRLTPGDAIPEGATLESGSWDHEHCALCWKKIMENGGDFQDGYSDGKDWLCPECYEQYIALQ